MGSGSKYEELGGGVIRRRERKKLGLFIDGTGLDRASRRVNRKVDMSALVRGVSSGIIPAVARYYTLIPYEDDSRQRAFLDAVSRAGLKVVVKRLPPKGVNRQVSTDIEMAADMVAFSMGADQFPDDGEYRIQETAPSAAKLPKLNPMIKNLADDANPSVPAAADGKSNSLEGQNESRLVTVVCPSRDIAYAISLIKLAGVDTTTADFGQFATSDILKSAAKWIDLSDSETIWRE